MNNGPDSSDLMLELVATLVVLAVGIPLLQFVLVHGISAAAEMTRSTVQLIRDKSLKAGKSSDLRPRGLRRYFQR